MGGTTYDSSERAGRTGKQAYLLGAGIDKQTSTFTCERGREGVFSGDDVGDG